MELKTELIDILNLHHNSLSTPASWNKDVGVLIFKGYPNEKEKLKSFRGLSLGSNIGKLYERVLRSRIDKYVEENKILGEMQGAYRKNRSLLEQNFIMNQLLEISKRKKQKYYIIAIDLSKAFDMVDRKKLLDVLENNIGDSKLNEIVKSLYKDTMRKFKTSTGYTKWIKYTLGVKQGAILSPGFFNLFMKELGEKVQKTGLGICIGDIKIACLLFADDVLLFASSKEEADELLKIVSNFINERQLLLNEDKTKIISSDKLYNHPLLNQESWEGYLKYLGLYIEDSNHMWKLQRELMGKNLIKKRNEMHAIIDQSLDKFNLADLIWKGEVIPAALYGCEIVIMTKTLLKQLNTQQNVTLRRLFKAHKSTNGAILRSEMGWESVESMIYKRKLNFWHYLCNLPAERWAKKVFLEARKQNTNWFIEIEEIKQKIGIDHSMIHLRKNEAKRIIHKKVIQWDASRNEKSIFSCNSLIHYKKYIQKGRKQYINDKSWIGVNKFITGQVILYTKSAKLRKCPLCYDDIEPDAYHILGKCKFVAISNNFPFIMRIRKKYSSNSESTIYDLIDEILSTKVVDELEEC